MNSEHIVPEQGSGDSPSGPEGSADTPAAFSLRGPLDLLLSKRIRSCEFWFDEHFASRVVEQHFDSRSGRPGKGGEYGRRDLGDVSSRVLFDGRWNCSQCRPFNERREGNRLVESLEGRSDLWVSVVPSADRDRAVGVSGERGLDYVVIPVYGEETVLITDGPLDANSEPVVDVKALVADVMRNRWTQHSLASSRGFLKPARIFYLWEAHHPKTGRRCWHLHDSKDDAHDCAKATGLRLNDSTKGWYVRGCSAVRSLGRFKATTKQLMQLANELGIKHRDEVIPGREGEAEPPAEHRTEVVLEPMAWNDPRFVKLREQAGWKRPAGAGENWAPPPYYWISKGIRVKPRGQLIA